MSPRNTVTNAQSPKPRKAARKYPLRSKVAATAVAAAGIGAIGASAAAPWAHAVDGLAMASHTPSGASDKETTGGIHLDARVVHVPGFAGTLATGNLRAPLAASIASHGFNSIWMSPAAHTQTPAAAVPGAQHDHAAPAKSVPAALAKSAPAPAAPVAKAASAHAAPAHAAPASANAAPAHAAPVAKAAPAHAAPAKAAPAHAGVHLAAAHAAPAPVSRPYTIYDSVTPGQIPANQNVATYANGAYAASPSAVTGRGHVLWIDTNGSDTHAGALDVEPGDATPSGAAQWVQAKLGASPGSVAIVYTMISDWQSVKDNVGSLPHWMQSHVRYWIADPTGVPHVLPGSNATQWYWGNSYDITTANPGFQS